MSLYRTILFVFFAVLFCGVDPFFGEAVAKNITPATASAAEPAGFMHYASEGKQFSVQVPSDWDRDESPFLKAHKEYGVRLRAPGLKDLGYVIIDIACYGAAHRTAERFIFDKLNPAWSSPGEKRGPVRDMTVSGMKAKTFEVRSTRYPIAGIGDAKVEALEQYVVLGAGRGFYLLSYNAPVEIAERYRPQFEMALRSFKPLTKAKAVSGREDEITDEEYAVFTDFFSIQEAPRIDSPSPLPLPSEGGLVNEMTSSEKKLNKDHLTNLEKSFGKIDASLIDSYNNRNSKDYRITDKVLVNKVRIFTEDEREEIRAQGGFGKGFSQELMRRHPLEGEIIYLSRVGFNKEMNSALFYAGRSSGVMGAGYFVLMEKAGTAWQLKNAALENFWYY